MTETDTELMLDVGQANELKLAFRKAGWKNTDIKRLCEGDAAERTLLILRGQAELTIISHIIDCDADPVIPQGWNATIEFHQKGGQVKWELKGDKAYLNGEEVVLHRVKGQVKGKVIEGHELRKKLTGEKVLNANVLDYLLKHPELIPESWKKDSEGNTLYIFFWGTIFRNSDGDLHVRYLYFVDGQWLWSSGWLDRVWDVVGPAAVLGK